MMTLFSTAPRFWLAVALLAVASPAVAGNTLIAGGTPVAVAKSTLTVTPDREWNKMGARPGRNSETWTIDGDALNDLTFYGGIEDGRALFREVSKRTKPLPRFSATMLLTDIPALVETSYRIALDTPLMAIDAVEPGQFAGQKAVRFRYHFTRQSDEVERKGEAVAAIIDGKLYMTTFEAPTLYFFDRDVEAFRIIAKTARIG
jgi:hypothetical protein